MQVGDIVFSAAGRDKGRYFAVLSVSDGYCLLADGVVRKCGKPKRKKVKHVIMTGARSELIAETVKRDGALTNNTLKGEIAKCEMPHEPLGVKEVESLG